MNRKVLLFSFTIASLFHMGGICWLYFSPPTISSSSFHNRVERERWEATYWERVKRTELLAEAIGQLAVENGIQRKELFQELQLEAASPLAISFPTTVPAAMSQADFSFRNSLSYSGEQWGIEEGELLAGSSLIAPLPPSLLIGAPPLADINSQNDYLSQSGVVAGSDHFDIQVEYAPKRSRPGYVFKVTLLPKADVAFRTIRQNFYFLLDRSNSMPRMRYQLNKQAVVDALGHLNEGDRFNILVFDDRVVRFKNQLAHFDPDSLEQAKIFLEGQGHGGYFAATDLYASLGKIIPQDVAEDEVNTAILLSDGDSYLSQEKQRLTIGGWTKSNQGKVALFTVTSGRGNNIPLLELLSTFNKGCHIHAQNHTETAKRLLYLMKTLQTPIGKEMVANAIPEDPSMTVLLQPKSSRIPNLYQNRPFVIYGSTNKLGEFILFLQGKYYNQLFDIKKRVKLDQANLGSFSVERGWAHWVAQEFYERYFEEGDISILEEAKQLLVHLNLPTPFID